VALSPGTLLGPYEIVAPLGAGVMMHRDLKPGNVMLTRSGAKLRDFGLAHATGMATGRRAFEGKSQAHRARSSPFQATSPAGPPSEMGAIRW
jgi:serine/threonine protein kinase